METRTIEVESNPAVVGTKLKLAVPTGLPCWLTVKSVDWAEAFWEGLIEQTAKSAAKAMKEDIRGLGIVLIL